MYGFFAKLACVLLAGALPCCVLMNAAQAAASHAVSSSNRTAIRIPATLAVRKELPPPPAGVTELKFRDVFKLPVGPKGLEPTDKLRALDGKRVRIVGYMVQQETPARGGFLLSPLPAQLGDEDESLADDLPASAIRIELPSSPDLIVPGLPGLVQMTGTLRVGMRNDATSGRATAAQLVLDKAPERALRRLAQSVAASVKKAH